MNMMNKRTTFHEDSPSGKKFNSISRVRLNFRRRPILCTTLYRNPMHASNFGGPFDQLFLWIIIRFWQKMPLNVFYAMVQKWPKTQIKGEGGGGIVVLLQISQLCKLGKLRRRDDWKAVRRQTPVVQRKERNECFTIYLLSCNLQYWNATLANFHGHSSTTACLRGLQSSHPALWGTDRSVLWDMFFST